jgi:hypothetical protein
VPLDCCVSSGIESRAPTIVVFVRDNICTTLYPLKVNQPRLRAYVTFPPRRLSCRAFQKHLASSSSLTHSSSCLDLDADPFTNLSSSSRHTAPHPFRTRSPPPRSLSASPPPRRALTDVSNAAKSASISSYASGRLASSSRDPDPHVALLDVRRAAALAVPGKSSRRPKKGNELRPSAFRPHVPADRRVLLWTSAHSIAAHSAMQLAGRLKTSL